MSEFSRPLGVEWNGADKTYGNVQYVSPNTNNVLFFMKSARHEYKSQAAGRPIHHDVEYVRIHPPGERLNIVERPAHDGDRQVYALQYARFLANKTQTPEGTPIEQLFPNFPSVADNLRAIGVHTIEQCAKLTSSAMDTVGMGAQEYVTKAKQYLESANSNIGFHKLQSQIKTMENELQVRDQQIKQLKDQMNALSQRISNPALASETPPFVPGYDAQADRINANHTTKLMADTKKAPFTKK